MSRETYIGPDVGRGMFFKRFRKPPWAGKRRFGRRFGGGFPGKFGGRFFETGEMRLALLALIAEQPRHGYELMTELETRSEGAYRPSPGSVYPNLQQLEDQGLVTSHKEDGKNVFTVTEAGKKEVEDQREAIDNVWSKAKDAGDWGPMSDPGAMEIFRTFKDFGKTAFIAVSKRGVDPDEIRKIIDEAREKIEQTESKK